MNTKYPIIFVHGIAIRDLFFIKSFGRIDSNLKKAFVHVRNELFKLNSRVNLKFNAGVYRLGKNANLVHS